MFRARVIPAAPPLSAHSNTSASIFPLRSSCFSAVSQTRAISSTRVYVRWPLMGFFFSLRTYLFNGFDLHFPPCHMASVVTEAHEMPCVSRVLLLSHGFGWDFAGCNIPWHSQGVIRPHDLSPFMLFFKGNCSFFSPPNLFLTPMSLPPQPRSAV